MRVRTWNTSDETDAAGYYGREHIAIVVFEFSDIVRIRLEGEDADRQNVISGLRVERSNDIYKIDLAPCYGISGEIIVKRLAVRLEKTIDTP